MSTQNRLDAQIVGKKLRDEAGRSLPAFDESLHFRILSIAKDKQALLRLAPGGIRYAGRLLRRSLVWPATIVTAAAACAAVGLFVARSASPQPDDLSASLAAVTQSAVTQAAAPAGEVAAVPLRHARESLAALHDDTQRLARFVGDRLDVLPG